MGRNRYDLFGRDRDTNKVKLISLSDYDIYGFGTDVRRINNSLDAIDFMTLNFRNEGDLVNYLVDTGSLDNYNTEVFIVSRNGDNITYLENVYSNSELSSELKKASEEKLKGLPKSFSNDTILDRFAFMMINDRRFRRFIESKYHKVYSKYVDYFRGCYNMSDAYNIKYSNSGWARDSYPLLRNIVETINRYEKLKKYGGDIYNLALDYEVDLNSVRNMNKDEISIYTDKGYEEGQLNLFLDNNEEENKLNSIMNFIHQLDSDSFVIEDDEVVFNKEKFDISYFEYEKLNNLDKRLMRLIYVFLITKKFNEVDGYSEQSNNNVTITAIRNINKLLSEDEKMLNKAYAFCLQYSRLTDKKIDSKIYKKVKGE